MISACCTADARTPSTFAAGRARGDDDHRDDRVARTVLLPPCERGDRLRREEREAADRARQEQRHLRPAVEEREARAPRAPQVLVDAAGARHRRRELGEAERARERDRRAERPHEQRGLDRARLLHDLRGLPEDAGADRGVDHDRGRGERADLAAEGGLTSHSERSLSRASSVVIAIE
nr:hypothetical protein [Sandaracinus amylolyticus]